MVVWAGQCGLRSDVAPVFTVFGDRLARQAGQKVHVIVDGHPVHRSKAVRDWLDANTDRVELHFLPTYSPELNPDELLNADLKRHVHASRAHTAGRLARHTRRFLHTPPAPAAPRQRLLSELATPRTRSCRQPKTSPQYQDIGRPTRSARLGVVPWRALIFFCVLHQLGPYSALICEHW